MRDFWKKIWKKYKVYLIVTAVFLLLVLFVDENNLFVMSRLHREVRQLHREEQVLNKEIVADSLKVAHLIVNIDSMERYGREEYLMKRADEDVYVVEE